jgi:Flp pilus assembly pilin Flp
MRRLSDLVTTSGPRSDERGGVVVEYTVILVLVSLVAGLAVAALGPSLVRTFLAQETWLLLGLP